MNLKQNYQKTTNYLKEVDWEKTTIRAAYISLHLVPTIPTIFLALQYLKPKEKRSDWKLGAGYAGFVYGTIRNLLAIGIISLTFLDTCNPSRLEEPKEEIKTEQNQNKKSLENTLEIEKTLY